MLAVISPVLLVLLPIALICIFIILKNSRWWDRMSHKITDEPKLGEPPTETVINRMERTKDALGKRAKDREKQADKLKAESKQISDYLGNSGETKDAGKEEGQ